MAMFWGESPENQARYNLRYALWNIRKLFKNSEDFDPIISTRTSCQLNPDLQLTIDSSEFVKLLATPEGTGRAMALKQAFDIYKGPFLDGFTIRNLPDWEEWLYHRREVLHESFLQTAVELGNNYLNKSQPDEAAAVFMRALSAAPYLEPAHEGLIRAYADQGRSSAALRQYNLYVKAMKREFNAPPNVEITALTEQLKAGAYVKSPVESTEETSGSRLPAADEMNKPLLHHPLPFTLNERADTPPEPSVVVLKAPDQPAEAPPDVSHLLAPIEIEVDTILVGREEELREIQYCIEEVQSGRGQVLIISGEMGIGKTRLFKELIRKLPPDFFIAATEAQEINASRPLEDLMQMLESFERDPRLSGNEKAELRNLFSLHRKIEVTAEDITETHLLDAVHHWIVSLAKRAPVLIAIDDLHWANRTLLRVFETLAQDAKRLPLLIVGIFRTFEVQTENTIAGSLVSIARTGRLKRLELSQLSPEETIQLITQKAVNIVENILEEDLNRLSRYSGGIPLFAVELANYLREEHLNFIRSPILFDQPDFTTTDERKMIPPLMLKIAQLRLSQLEKTQCELIKIASLILGEFSLNLLEELLPQDLEALEVHLVDLEHRNLLHHLERGDQLTFTFNHLLIKLSIVETIPALQRRRLYKRIVHAIQQVRERCSPDAMAYYLFNAGERSEAIPYLLASSRRWFSYGEKSIGLRYSKAAFPIALEKLADQPEEMIKIILEHGENLLHHGHVQAAIDVYTQVIVKLEEIDMESERSLLVSRREELKNLLKDEPAPAATINLAPLALVTAKRAMAQAKLVLDEFNIAEKLIQEAREILDNLPDSSNTIRETGMIFQVQAKLYIQKESFDQAEWILYNSLELLRQNGTAAEIAESYRLLARLYRKTGEFEKAGTVLKQCKELYAKKKDLYSEAEYYYELGMLRFDQNALEEADNCLRKSLQFCCGSSSLTSFQPTVIADLVLILEAKGKNKLAQKIREKSLHLGEESSPTTLDDILEELNHNDN